MKYTYGFSGDYYVYKKRQLEKKLLEKYGVRELLYVALDPETGECTVYGTDGVSKKSFKVKLPPQYVRKVVMNNSADVILKFIV